MTIDAINKLMFAEKVRKGLTTDRSFYIEEGRAGITNLEAGITLNNITVYPTSRYRVEDQSISSWPAWGYGATLSLTGTGTDPTIVDNPFHDSGKAIQFNAGKRFSGTGLGTLKDRIFELYYWHSGNANRTLINNYNGSAPFFDFYCLTDGSVIIGLRDGIDEVDLTFYVTPYTWNHVLVFWNIDEASTNGAKVYVNGIVNGSGANISSIGTVGTGNLNIGAYGNDTSNSSNKIALVSAYEYTNWFQAGASGPSEWAAFAKSRYHSLLGIGPHQVNKSSSYTLSSASAHYLDKLDSSGNTKLHYMGAGNIRQVERKDSLGDSWKGLLCEYQSTNLLTNSSDFSAGSWYKPGTSDTVTVNCVTAPDGTETADGLVAYTDDRSHGFVDGITLAEGLNAISCYFKPGEVSWLLINSSFGGTYFDCANGVIGSSYLTPVLKKIEPCSNGFYKCSIVVNATAGSDDIIYLACPANLDYEFAGNGSSISGYFWGAQAELLDYPSSPIVTSGTSITRASEYIYYPSLGNIGSYEGWIKARVLFPSYTHGSTGSTVWTLSDNGASTDRICLFIGGSGYVNAFSSKTDTTGDASVTIEQNVCDGQVWDIVCTWCNGHFVLGAQAIHSSERYWDEDTSADIPYVHGPNGRLHIACDQSNTGQLGPGILIDLEVLPKYNRSFRRK